MDKNQGSTLGILNLGKFPDKRSIRRGHFTQNFTQQPKAADSHTKNQLSIYYFEANFTKKFTHQQKAADSHTKNWLSIYHFEANFTQFFLQSSRRMPSLIRNWVIKLRLRPSKKLQNAIQGKKSSATPSPKGEVLNIKYILCLKNKIMNNISIF